MRRGPAASEEAPAEALSVDGRVVGPVELARTRRQRSRGLLGRDGLDGALWLDRCHQVHTFRMRFPIDVAYVDRRGRVVAVRRMPRGRVGPLVVRARAVVEAEAGSFDVWGVRTGSVLAREAVR